MTVGAADPAKRDKEAVAWVSSNYVTGFTYRWDRFKAPVAGRYRIRFSGYTLWVAPLAARKSYLPDCEHISRGHRDEAINVYTRNGVLNRHVGSFDLTPEPAAHDIGEVWLLAGETLVPDASRLYRSRPNNFRNPLMTRRWRARRRLPMDGSGRPALRRFHHRRLSTFSSAICPSMPNPKWSPPTPEDDEASPHARLPAPGLPPPHRR